MATIKELQQAILKLPEEDCAELLRWLLELDWERWDRELDEDIQAGKLDALAAEALEAKAKGLLKPL